MASATDKIARTYGREYVADTRDRHYRLRTRRTTRKYRYWRCGQVTDQGAAPNCVGHAWANWLAASPVRQRPIAPDGIYTLAQYHDEWEGQDYEGTSVRGAAKVLTITGHISEYRWEWRLTPAIEYLLVSGPLVLGVNWYEGMEEPDLKGVIHADGRLLGGHAVLCYGANCSTQLVSIRNSWGRGWGDNGNCRISFADLDQLLSEDGECCAAVESQPSAQ